MWRAVKRLFHQASIGDQSYRFLFKPGPDDEVVVLDTETTGLDVKTDDIITIAAIKIRGDRILTSERFEAVARPDARMSAEAIKVHRLRHADVEGGELIFRILPDFLRFVGGRPLVGYYIDFDVAMLDKYIVQLIGIELPNRLIEVSALYHERKYGDAPPGTQIDLRFAAIMDDLGLPRLEEHDAFNDALMTGMMYLALRDLKRRNVRISRQRQAPVIDALGA
ncbi:3'-5' exonuclease [Alsobacter sp. SYSU M60028]|uniref:3'-5' exonuclease n=1 Tax=Alsobacter ponti TaxID=2962936 RepID=A0ABT1LFX0_9HYPH|nr:3'-5' exonuclease [Alsobacter ponti]MCP8940397.1 3'-5' exonuclease [Alsobacter ponti]